MTSVQKIKHDSCSYSFILLHKVGFFTYSRDLDSLCYIANTAIKYSPSLYPSQFATGLGCFSHQEVEFIYPLIEFVPVPYFSGQCNSSKHNAKRHLKRVLHWGLHFCRYENPMTTICTRATRGREIPGITAETTVNEPAPANLPANHRLISEPNQAQLILEQTKKHSTQLTQAQTAMLQKSELNSELF